MPFSTKPPPKQADERIKDALSARRVARSSRDREAGARHKRRLAEAAQSAMSGEGRKRKMSGTDRFVLRFWMYFHKMRGQNPATYDFSVVDTLWSFGGAFLSMIVLAWLNTGVFGRAEQGLLVGSFGASAMLVFGAPHAPFAQPRNVIGGHIVSALAGVFVQQHFGADPWLASALAVALAVSAMHITATLHPPGGATSLIAVIGSQELKQFGYSYAFFPVGVSVAVMVLVGVLYNNLSRRRRYPVYWW